MTPTTRLAAIGVTLPEVEAYEQERTHTDGDYYAEGYVDREVADAALGAVVGELERAHRTFTAERCAELTTALEEAVDYGKRAHKAQRGQFNRAEAAEARLRIEGDHPFGDGYDALDLATDRIAALEAENKALRSHQACTKRAEEAEATLTIARACAECNTHGACSTPWPAEEAAECPGVGA